MPGGWAAAAAKFRGRIGQIDSLAAIAQARGESPAEWEQAVDLALRTAVANASRLAKPMGAVVYFLRNGMWPVDLVSPEQRAATEAKRTTSQSKQAEKGSAFALIRSQRRAGVDDDVIAADLRAKFSPELLAEMGWK